MKTKAIALPSPSRQADWWLFLLLLIITIVGIIFVFDASVAESLQQFSDKYHFARHQVSWAALGICLLLITTRLPMRWLQKLSRPLFILSLILLVIVLIPGIGLKIQGARRWLPLGFANLQPSELIKLAAILYFPTWLIPKPKLQPFIALTGVIMFLLLLEPDLGTTLVIAGIAFTLFFIAGAPVKHVLFLALSGLVIGSILIVSSPYRRARLTTFLDPTSDPLGSSYHIRQIIISLGSGGIFGTGFGRSRQKFQFLPEATTDSIFAVMAEEIGFVGGLVIISLYLLFLFRAFKIISHIQDPYPQLIAVGATTWIMLQTLLNLGAMVSLVPLTGVPLPFISYGGSALVTLMTVTGLLLNSSRYRSATR